MSKTQLGWATCKLVTRCCLKGHELQRPGGLQALGPGRAPAGLRWLVLDQLRPRVRSWATCPVLACSPEPGLGLRNQPAGRACRTRTWAADDVIRSPGCELLLLRALPAALAAAGRRPDRRSCAAARCRCSARATRSS